MMAEPAKQPLKRPLFNKPAWSRPQKVVSPAEFFHRSSSSYNDLAAEAERKRKAKYMRKQARGAAVNGDHSLRTCSSESDEDSEGSTRPLDHDFQEKDAQRIKQRVDSQERHAAPPTSTVQQDSIPQSLSKRYEDSVNSKKANEPPKLPPSNIIELEDSSDEGVAPETREEPTVTPAFMPPAPEEDDFPPSDDEYAELARKAREKARRKRLEDDMTSATYEQSRSAEPEIHSQHTILERQSTPQAPPPDPEVHILITSDLGNTKPLIIKRKLSQRLKDVRVTWCQHQQFTAEMTKTVFLTWRGKRLFDVTSCKSLGIAVDADGNVSSNGQVRLFGEEEQKIHMEAMTEELLEERKKAKERKAKEAQENTDEGESEVPQKPQEPQTRIILKAKGFDDFKLIVKSVSLQALGDALMSCKLTVASVYPRFPYHRSFPSGSTRGNGSEGCLFAFRWGALGAGDEGWRDRAQRYGLHRYLRQMKYIVLHGQFADITEFLAPFETVVYSNFTISPRDASSIALTGIQKQSKSLDTSFNSRDHVSKCFRADELLPRTHVASLPNLFKLLHP